MMEETMPVRPLSEVVQARVAADPEAATALFREAIEAMLRGELEVGRPLLRDYIKGTIGFEQLAKATGTPPASLSRMFGPKGNPNARNLFAVVGRLQELSGVTLAVGALLQTSRCRSL
jgi:DNA-binding phage protein